jgi:hypothetical protein
LTFSRPARATFCCKLETVETIGKMEDTRLLEKLLGKDWDEFEQQTREHESQGNNFYFECF